MAILVSTTPFPNGSNFDPDDVTVQPSEVIGFKSNDEGPIVCTTSVNDTPVAVFYEQNGSSQFTATTKSAEYKLLDSLQEGTLIVLSIDGNVNAKAGSNGKLRVGSGM